MNIYRRLVCQPPGPYWLYCLRATLLAVMPALVVSALLYLAMYAFNVDPSSQGPKDLQATAIDVFGTVIFAPVVETLVLAWTVTLARRANISMTRISIASAIAWGLLHGLQSWVKFFPTAWGFFVFTTAYQVWREVSFKRAFFAALLPHALANSFVMAAVFADAGA